MMTEWTWNEFCELYFDTAKKTAEMYLQKQARKLGGLDRRVDLDYVRDSAALTAMEKAYAHYDASKGAKITTYLSTLVHNEIVDLLEKESKAAAVQRDLDDVKSAIKALADEGSPDAPSAAARAKLWKPAETISRRSSASEMARRISASPRFTFFRFTPIKTRLFR